MGTSTAHTEGRLRPSAPGAVPATLLATVIFLTAVAPLATDMYVPAFPRVSDEFGSSASAVQLTLTTFFAGMGLGQLVGGPFSDQRRPAAAAGCGNRTDGGRVGGVRHRT